MILLQKATAKKIKAPSSWLLSEKLDGERAWWDGGVSRGLITIPWRRRAKMDGIEPCTGLWTGNGNIIHAPDWFLDSLPAGVILDGELWAGRGGFQQVMSAVRKKTPVDWEWRKIKFMVFDAPTCDEIFQTRKIDIPTCKMIIRRDDCVSLFAEQGGMWLSGTRTVRESMSLLGQLTVEDCWAPLRYREIGFDLDKTAEDIYAQGGEGLIIRDPSRGWTPNRVPWIVKVKREQDGEGVIWGFVTGKGKYLGMLGSIEVAATLSDQSSQTVVFNLSGFTDEERRLSDSTWAKMNPGSRLPMEVQALHFARGAVVRFKYRELSNDGVPKEARFDRGR